MIKEQDIYKIGQLTRTHGVRGEVSMSFTDDVWDRADSDYLILCVDGIPVPFFLEEYRFRSDRTALVKFQGYDTSEAAQLLVGCDVYFPHALTPETDEETDYSWCYFTGFTLIDTKTGNLGTIDYVDDSTPNILFHAGSKLIPAAEDWIDSIDHKARIITMSLPEGLLDL